MSDGKDTIAASLLGTGTWLRQGPATLVLRENAWVVLVPGLRKQVIEAAWTLLGEKPTPEEFLDKLVETGELESADKLTALLFGFHDGTRAVFGVKGTTPIAVYTADGSQQIAGTEDEPFVLRTLDGVRRVAFGDLPAEDAIGAARLDAGVIPVRGFVHVTMDPAELDESERAALAEQVENDGRSIEDPEAKQRRAARPTPSPTPTSASPAVSKLVTATRTSGEMPSSASRGGSAPSTPARGSTAAGPAAEPESSEPNLFDGLLGDSTAGPAAAAGIARTPKTAPEPEAAPASEAAPTAAPTEAQVAPTPAPTQSSAPLDAPAPAQAPSVASTPDPVAAAASASAPAVAAAGGEAPQATNAGKRRLVSTSLFDRGRRGRPAASATPTDASEPTPAEPAKSPDAAVMPPAEQTAAAAPPSPAVSPTSSIPTPEPPGEEADESPDTQIAPVDDDLASPDTQIAPIEDEGEQHEGSDAAPRRASAPRRAASPAPDTSDLENSGAYDDLFGKTVFRRIEDAAVRRIDEDEEAESGETEQTGAAPTGAAPTSRDAAATAAPASPTSADSASPAESATEPEPEPSSAPSEFIDWVPGVGRTAPEIAQTAARRASAPHEPEPAYPQVQMAERPPTPNTGSRPAPTGPPTPHEQLAPSEQPAPYEQAGPYPPTGAPMTSGVAGQQVGYPGAQPQQYSQAPANPLAAGHQLGFPGPQRDSVPGYPPQGVAPRQGAASPPGPAVSAHPPGRYPASQQAAPQQGGGQGMGQAVALPGLVCANGHASSPERGACRFCGAPLHGPARTVSRPPLGAVTIAGGGRFLLDRTAIVGRRPRASRVSAQDVPQLITVPSPQQDISRSHLELRLEGWHVVALDLGTTNGTTLYREGFEPVRLRPREGVILHDRDHLDLGDDVHLMFGERA